MSEDEHLPAGPHLVCPRCGVAASEGIWCENCGLNLRQQGELPTADAYTARIREQRWLASQSEQAEAARAEQARRDHERRAAESAQRARETQEHERLRAEATQRKKAERAEKKATRRPRRKTVLVGLCAALGALLAIGAAWLLFLRSFDSEQTAGPQPNDPRPTGEEAAAPPPRCSRKTAQRELVRRDLLGFGFPGISRLICRDLNGDGVKDAAFTRTSTGSSGTLGWGVLIARPGRWAMSVLEEEDAQVGIKADGSDLLRSAPVADAADPNYKAGEGAVIEVYRQDNGMFRKVNEYRQPGEAFPDGFYEESGSEEASAEAEQCGDSDPAPIYNVTAENVDCETALEVAEAHTQADDLGWTCTDEDTGYESSRYSCTKGDARVTYDFAV